MDALAPARLGYGMGSLPLVIIPRHAGNLARVAAGTERRLGQRM
jgi:hypothetical protein